MLRKNKAHYGRIRRGETEKEKGRGPRATVWGMREKKSAADVAGDKEQTCPGSLGEKEPASAQTLRAQWGGYLKGSQVVRERER